MISNTRSTPNSLQRRAFTLVEVPARRRGNRNAFTLVEVLVVIGIIAILISILLPTLSAARRQANLVRCSANLRQLTEACLLRANDSHGWLPLAGEIVPDPSGGPSDILPNTLNDPYQRRYVYAHAPSSVTGGIALVPLPGAIGPMLGHRDLDFSNWYILDQQLNNQHGAWKMFMCPGTDAFSRAKKNDNSGDETYVDQGTLLAVLEGNSPWAWSTNTDYVMNEGVFGFHYSPEYRNARLNGQLSRIRRPSEVCLFTDGQHRPDPVTFWATDGWMTWTPPLKFDVTPTLGDALDENGQVSDAASFDRVRHKGRINVAFADAHVETLVIDARELKKVYLLPPP